MMDPGYDFLDTIDWCVLHNLCVARILNDDLKTYTYMVGLYEGTNRKKQKGNPNPRR